MSVPGVDIFCDRCEYRGSTVVVFGRFNYSTPYGIISLPRTLGWCSTCSSLAPIEDANHEVRIKSLAADRADSGGIEQEKKNLRRNTPFLKRIFSSRKAYSEALRMLLAKKAWISSELSSPVLLADYLSCSRKPRCLTCGSTEVSEVPEMPGGLNDFYDRDRIKVPIGMDHPGCGGQLLASTSRVRLNIRFEVRVYNLSGERIAYETILDDRW
jgi:hypothetical protein